MFSFRLRQRGDTMGLEFVENLMDRGLLNYVIDEALKAVDSGVDKKEQSRLFSLCSNAMFQKRQYIDAVTYGEKAVKADPENGEAFSHLGWAEYWLGKNESAVIHLNKAVDLNPDSAETHYRLGSILNNALGKPAEAEAEFTRTVELDPTHSLAWQQRAISRFNQERKEEAYADYREAAALGDPYSGYILNYYGEPLDTPEEKIAFARDCWAQNQSQQAVDLIESALAQGFSTKEKEFDIRLELADKLSSMKINDKSEASYNSAIELFGDSAEAYSRRGWLYYCTSRDEAAEADYKTAMKLDPSNSRYPENLGTLYSVSGKPELGVEVLDTAIEKDPLSAGLFYARALCHKALGNEDQAKKDFNRADYFGHSYSIQDRRNAYGDNFAMDFFNSGIEKGDSSDYRGAMEAFRKGAELFGAAKVFPGDWNWRYTSKCLHNLGYYIHISDGDPAEAIKAIDESIEMDPGYKDAWISLGNVYNGTGNDKKALECYNKAIELQPNDGRGYYSRGRVNMAREAFDAGVEDFSQAIIWYNRKDWQADAFFNRARCHEGAGRIQEAIADYQEAFNNGIQQGITESFRLKDQYGID